MKGIEHKHLSSFYLIKRHRQVAKRCIFFVLEHDRVL